MSSEIEAGPLKEAPPDDEHRAGPLKKVPPQRVRKTGRERRWERQRRRRFFEEILGWVLVPVILVALYWAVKASLAALGTDLTSLVQGIKAVITGAGGGR